MREDLALYDYRSWDERLPIRWPKQRGMAIMGVKFRRSRYAAPSCKDAF